MKMIEGLLQESLLYNPACYVTISWETDCPVLLKVFLYRLTTSPNFAKVDWFSSKTQKKDPVKPFQEADRWLAHSAHYCLAVSSKFLEQFKDRPRRYTI